MKSAIKLIFTFLLVMGSAAPTFAFKQNVEQLYLRGSFNNWGLLPLNLSDNHLWKVKIYFPKDNTEFKFDVYGDWRKNFGTNSQDQVADVNGYNIKVTSGRGNYLITFNDLSLAYTVEKLSPSNRSPRANAGRDIVIKEGELAQFSAIRTKDFDGKIVRYEWSNGLTGIRAEKRYYVPGSYYVILTVTDDDGATGTDNVHVVVNAIGAQHNFKQLYLRGTNNDWGKTKLVAKGHHEWELITRFGLTQNERFKIDVNGDWRQNYGDSNKDGIADPNGDDILVLEGEGNYRITLNDQTLEYKVEKLPSIQQ